MEVVTDRTPKTFQRGHGAGAANLRRILVVDDHPIVRHGVCRLIDDEIDLRICADVGIGAAIQSIEDSTPDLVITEISFSRADGIAFVRRLRKLHPSMPILVLSILDEGVFAERLLSVGANGYMMKNAPAHLLVGAVRRLLNGQRHVSETLQKEIEERVIHGPRSALDENPVECLTNRELQVIRMIGQGMSSRLIAKCLCLSTKTIESHRERIKKKLHLKNGIQLVQFSVSGNLGEQTGGFQAL